VCTDSPLGHFGVRTSPPPRPESGRTRVRIGHTATCPGVPPVHPRRSRLRGRRAARPRGAAGLHMVAAGALDHAARPHPAPPDRPDRHPRRAPVGRRRPQPRAAEQVATPLEWVAYSWLGSAPYLVLTLLALEPVGLIVGLLQRRRAPGSRTRAGPGTRRGRPQRAQAVARGDEATAHRPEGTGPDREDGRVTAAGRRPEDDRVVAPRGGSSPAAWRPRQAPWLWAPRAPARTSPTPPRSSSACPSRCRASTPARRLPDRHLLRRAPVADLRRATIRTAGRRRQRAAARRRRGGR